MRGKIRQKQEIEERRGIHGYATPPETKELLHRVVGKEDWSHWCSTGTSYVRKTTSEKWTLKDCKCKLLWRTHAIAGLQSWSSHLEDKESFVIAFFSVLFQYLKLKKYIESMWAWIRNKENVR